VAEAKEVTSFRLDAPLAKAVRDHAAERGQSASDSFRDAVLLLLGYCPTCGRKAGAAEPGSDEAVAADA